MNYLFMAVQKEAERSEEFGSREEDREYFEKRFGEDATEKKEQGSGCRLEERADLRCQPVFGETSLILRLVGIFRIGSRYRVIEERYYCSGWKGFGEDGILEIDSVKFSSEIDKIELSCGNCYTAKKERKSEHREVDPWQGRSVSGSRILKKSL